MQVFGSIFFQMFYVEYWEAGVFITKPESVKFGVNFF